MVCRSQLIPLRELWGGFNPTGFRKGLFVQLRGYMDESYGNDQNVFAWSCLIARGKEWTEMERRWKLCLRAKNKELAKAGRPIISRYHASDCSGRRGEFEGWTLDERDAFVLELFGLFRQFQSHTVVYDAQLNDICTVFPEWSKQRLAAAYYLLTLFVMFGIGRDFRQIEQKVGTIKKTSITLFHDRTGNNGEYDPTILRAFNQQVTNPYIEYRDYFTTIAPLSWEKCVALQPADLVAFECFKEAEGSLEARKSRKSYKALVEMKTFGIHSMMVTQEALQGLRENIEHLPFFQDCISGILGDKDL